MRNGCTKHIQCMSLSNSLVPATEIPASVELNNNSVIFERFRARTAHIYAHFAQSATGGENLCSFYGAAYSCWGVGGLEGLVLVVFWGRSLLRRL